MNMQQRHDTHKQVLLIERDISYGSIKTVSQLIARTGKTSLPYSAYRKLHQMLLAKRQADIPMFLRKQAF